MKVIIFGAGMMGQRNIPTILKQGHEILCFVDNDTAKQGKTLALEPAGGGQKFVYEICPPQRLLALEFDKVFVLTMQHREVVQQLTDELQIPTHKIDTSFVNARSTARHAFLREFAQIASERKLDGDCAECGVYRGEFARLINAHFPTQKLYLFDTFESFAPQDLERETPDVQKCTQLFANTSVPLVLSKMPHAQNCIVRKGWFPDTARGLEDARFCFVSLDTDLYDPILAGLEFFYPRLVCGGAILVDDYFDPSFRGVKQAVDCFARAHRVVFAPIGDSSSIVLVRGE